MARRGVANKAKAAPKGHPTIKRVVVSTGRREETLRSQASEKARDSETLIDVANRTRVELPGVTSAGVPRQAATLMERALARPPKRGGLA